MDFLLYIVGFMGFVVWAAIKMDVNKRLDNYDITRIDNAKLTRDMNYGVSTAERQRRLISGYYDK